MLTSLTVLGEQQLSLVAIAAIVAPYVFALLVTASALAVLLPSKR